MQSTYRLQFHLEFKFDDARRIVGYLSELGITHAYASPYLKARSGSTHGYDVVDPTQLNPEIGSTADYEAWLAALSAHGMSHILDTVPNHMGVGSNDNHWWNDVLEDGESSMYSDYFDIEWARDPERKLLLPILGKNYGEALEAGELKLGLDAGSGRIYIEYFERQVPIAPASVAHLLTQCGSALAKLGDDLARLPQRGTDRLSAKKAWKQKLAAALASSPTTAAPLTQRIAQLNGRVGHPESFDALHALLEAQSYRLASWKTAPERINYRRFFEINDLAALRMERDEVFRDVHALTLKLVDAGKVAGLRVDHPDGLRDPVTYFKRLQDGRTRQPLYVAIEKILAPDESLPNDWPVSGTSGYDFLNQINGLYVDPAGEAPLTALFKRWSEISESFSDLAIQKKRFLLQRSFPGDLHALAQRLEALVHADRRRRDMSFAALQKALGELIAHFPVYRTYVIGGVVSSTDAARVEEAMEQTLRHVPSLDREALRLIVDTLLLRWPAPSDSHTTAKVEDFIARFQQLTAPVTAKGVEDTAFYIYNRLVSLNEVGNDPGKFGVSCAELHRYLSDRQAHWPTALSCLSTHDTKRSEDVRARINVLSEIAPQWQANVDTWGRLNMPLHQLIDGHRAPYGNDEYLFYQTLLGVWPAEGITDELIERVRAYMTKAMREAKGATNWTSPNAAYETAALEFVTGAMRGAAGDAFLKSFGLFAERVIKLGLLNSISQTILRMLAPGVPDTYQGTELIDLSLVDPDNRRPVDYARRQAMLRAVRDVANSGAGNEIATSLREGLADGQTKLHITWRMLQLRKTEPILFTQGRYVPLRASGEQADHIFTFARQYEGQTLIVIVPRLMASLRRDAQGLPTGDTAWGNTRIDLRELLVEGAATDVLTGLRVPFAEEGIEVWQAFARFPAAVLLVQADRRVD